MFYDAVMDMITKAFYEIIANLDFAEPVSEVLFNAGYMNTLFSDFVPNVQNALSVIGCSLCVLFFLISIIELAMSERMSPEVFIKFFAKFAISIILVLNSTMLVNFCMDLGAAIGDLAIATENVTPAESGELLFNDDSSWLALLLQVGLAMLLSKIVALVLLGCMYIISFTRLIEMALRACFMPIALSLMADDGWKGAAGRYIKRFLALCTQGAALILICKINSALVAAIVEEAIFKSASIGILSATVLILAVGAASVSVSFKSVGIVNDVFGA